MIHFYLLKCINVWCNNLRLCQDTCLRNVLDGICDCEDLSRSKYESRSVKSVKTLKSEKINSQTKPPRVRLYKYRCNNIAVLFHLFTRGLFNASKRWAEGEDGAWGSEHFCVADICWRKLHTRIQSYNHTQVFSKECRPSLKCTVLPFMWFISSDVGAAG